MRPFRATKMNRRKIILLSFIFIGIFKSVASQSLNYEDLFGNDWKKALQFVDGNEKWMRPLLDRYKISYPVAVAVIFPELVRYSALRDKMETAMLKTLYRNLGDDYADFSIGVFQIKPSFAEKIREAVPLLEGWRIKSMFRKKSSYKNIRGYRSAIINDLEDPESEFNYIVAFFRLCEKYFPQIAEDDTSKIRFFANAYNTGFWKSREEIEKMSNSKFYNTKLFKTENYSYADVSLFWYKQYIQTNK
jgi:hypothetical protein